MPAIPKRASWSIDGRGRPTNRQIFRFLSRDPSITGVKMLYKLPKLILALAVLALAAAPVAEAQNGAPKKPAAARPAPKAAPAAKPQAGPAAAETDANGMPVIQTAAKFALLVDYD